jgi:hypothetical protein
MLRLFPERHFTEAVTKLFDNQSVVAVKRQRYTDHPTTRLCPSQAKSIS